MFKKQLMGYMVRACIQLTPNKKLKSRVRRIVVTSVAHA